MENRNMDRALDIVSRLIMGEQVSEGNANSQLYQEYNTNAEVYDIVQAALKKFNLNIYNDFSSSDDGTTRHLGK